MQMNKDRFVNYAAVSQYYCQLTILIRLGHNSLGSVTLDGLKMSHSYLMMSDVTLDTIYQITNSLLQFLGKLKHQHARLPNYALHSKNLKRLHIINIGTDFIIDRVFLLNDIYSYSYFQSLVFSLTFTILIVLKPLITLGNVFVQLFLYNYKKQFIRSEKQFNATMHT